MSRTFLGLMLFALAAGCSSQSSELGPVTLRRLTSSSYSGYREPKHLVVRDSGTWAEVWKQLWTWQSPEPDLPAIDFDREMVLVAALGERPNSGYSILIESARATVDQLTVSVRVESPGTGCGVLTVMTEPVDVVSVPRLDVGVQFVERSETGSCD
jgi:PrcB C-terminal